jgi:shikimate kinase
MLGLYNASQAVKTEQANSNRTRRIVLVGFMGAGKSTVGPILAHRLGWKFVDGDHYLQAKTGKTIPDLFSQRGEPEFRRLEAEAVAELHQETELVLALGGGAIETESTRFLLGQSDDTRLVFLKASLNILIDRCERQEGAVLRPLLQQRETLGDRFASRLRHYEQAHITVVTENLSPNTVVDRILEQLHEDSNSISLIPRVIAT